MSKEIKKRQKRRPDWIARSSVKGTLITYYMAPCFGHVYGVYGGDYIGHYGSSGSVGPIGDQIHPWNASSPLAKKEYDKKYKLWGRRVMGLQLTRGDDR